MTDPRSERSSVRYYCTAGNGMEHFLIDEVTKKLAAKDVCQMPGKVLFSSSVDINRVSTLKAAERLFLLLKQDSAVRLPSHSSPGKAASLLQSRLLGDRDQWTDAVMTWSRLQGELEDRRTIKPPVLGVPTKTEGEKDSEESRSVGQREESGTQRSGKENGTQTLEKKRKRDVEEEEEEEMSCKNNGKHGLISGTGSDQATAGPDLNVESSIGRIDDKVKDVAVENEKSAAVGRDDSLLQPSRIKPEPPSVPLSFRISCKCTGYLSRYFSTQEVNRLIGVGLSRLLGWKTDLKNPQLEINVYLSDDHCLMGIPLTRLPLANRCYIKSTGLRSTVAWAMASLAQIQPGFCVVDPMCGVGTILVEAAQEHKAACFLGIDIDDGQLTKANENVDFAQFGSRIHLLKASSMALPLPSASVDAVVCDLPFGRKFDTKTNMSANLPLILTEMERVLCIGGTLVLLLSPQLSCLLKKLLAQKDTESTTNQQRKPLTGTQDHPSPSLSSTSQQTFQIHQGVNSPPTPKPGCQPVPQHSQPPSLSSLKHQTTYRVSLGLIDGLIHKYVKMDN